jgi:hypothetical protein
LQIEFYYGEWRSGERDGLNDRWSLFNGYGRRRRSAEQTVFSIGTVDEDSSSPAKGVVTPAFKVVLVEDRKRSRSR